MGLPGSSLGRPWVLGANGVGPGPAGFVFLVPDGSPIANPLLGMSSSSLDRKGGPRLECLAVPYPGHLVLDLAYVVEHGYRKYREEPFVGASCRLYIPVVGFHKQPLVSWTSFKF